MIISRIQPGGPVWLSGACVGDVLLKIDGIDVDESTWLATQDAGESFLIQSLGKGGATPILIEGTARPPITSPLTAALLWIISSGFGLTGLFVFARSDRSGDVLRVSLLFLVAAIALALAPAAARWHPWAMVVETISIDWATALFFIFFYMFWRSASGISSQPWAVWAMAA